MFQNGLCGTLRISNITLTDTADYTCMASNTLAEPLSVNSSDISLTVNCKLDISDTVVFLKGQNTPFLEWLVSNCIVLSMLSVLMW